MPSLIRALFLSAVLFSAVLPTFGEELPIVEIPFESIPNGTQVLGAGGITLEGNVSAQGMIEASTGGFKFPDGSVQSTASAAGAGITGNSGLYDNRIVEMTPPQPFTEICIKGGQVFGDIHVASESTLGGNCVPGDLGFVIERNQRSAAHWENARFACLLAGMRLPEPFEWLYCCDNAGTFGLNDMIGDLEWISNITIPQTGSVTGPVASAAGSSSCNHGHWGWVAPNNGAPNSFTFRCVR